jgi:hypothetical protein
LRRTEVDRERLRLKSSTKKLVCACRHNAFSVYLLSGLRLLRSALWRPLSRDFGLSFESAFRTLWLFDLEPLRLRRSPPLLDDDEDDELKLREIVVDVINLHI